MPFEGFGEIAKRLRRSTVHVTAGRRGRDSGITLDPPGPAVTSAHVASARPLEVQLWDGTRVPAGLLLRDAARDLALLRAPGRVKVVEIVMAVGNPLGFVGALTTGVVHGVGAAHGLGARIWIQSVVRLALGNSGHSRPAAA